MAPPSEPTSARGGHVSGPGKGTAGDGAVRRHMGAFTATSIVVANIIGTGIFTTSGIMAGLLPSPAWVLACWAFGGLIAIAGAMCYAELATRMPEEGAEYVYLKKLYHPAFGFLTGWTSFIVGFSAPIAASAMGCAEYLFGGLDRRLLLLEPSQLAIAKKGVAIAVVAAFTLLHSMGLRAGARVQNVLTVLKIAIVLGLAAAGLALGGGHSPGLLETADDPFKWTAIGTAMMLVMFAYSGWNASAYVAGELRNARRALPLSLLAGTGIVIALYIALNAFIFRALPFHEARGTIAVVEKAAVRAFGEWMGRGLSLLVGISLLSSLSAYIIIGPRVYFAMARDRLFFSAAGKMHPRFGVPSRSIVAQGALAVMMVIVGSYEQLLVYLGFALGIFPWLAVAGLLVARRRGLGDETAVKARGYPAAPVFFLASTLALMIVAYVGRPLESTAAVATVLAGIPCYFLWIRAVNRAQGSRGGGS